MYTNQNFQDSLIGRTSLAIYEAMTSIKDILVVEIHFSGKPLVLD